MRYVLFAILTIYIIAYIVAMTEIIGSWILTLKKQNIRWDVGLNIMMPALLPFSAFFDAYGIYEDAKRHYDKRIRNELHFKESLFCYLMNGRRSIEENYQYWSQRTIGVKPCNKRKQKRSKIIQLYY